MLSVAEARDRILSELRPVSTEVVGLAECARRVLAEDIVATSDLPFFDNSSMDGFAIRAADAAPAGGPARLRVVADVRAGDAPTVRINEGEAARIMTGAQLPEGADAVVPVEDTDFDARTPGSAAPDFVSPARSVRRGENIRPRGQDAQQGDPMLRRGQHLRAQDLGLLAMLGLASVPIFRKPRVALFSSGDELLPLGAPLEPGKVRDSNTYTLGTLIEQSGGELLRLGVARDEYEAVEGQLERAVTAGADLIISSAGVSVGALDFVKEVVAAHGTLDFWRVNMRPGKPLAFGAYRGLPFIGLPGNPVSAFVAFEIFGRPAIGRLAGLPDAARERVRVVLEEDVESDGRESYLRAEVRVHEGQLLARLTGHQGSGNLLALVRANALLIIPAGVECVPAKREVDAWLL